MATFGPHDDLKGAEFRDVSLRGARFVGVSLGGAVVRGSEVDGLEIDSPWLLEGPGTLVVNGVDVAPFVDAELDRRFPGRARRRAVDPDGIRAAWAALEAAWDVVLARAAALPDGAVDVAVDGEWSFAQTLRHLVLATDLWLGQAVLGLEKPFHPLGLTNIEAADEGFDMSVFTDVPPTYDEVLAARASRVALVRDVLATATQETLDVPRRNPWAPDHEESTLSCVRTIVEEEWEHLRYAVRDLDALDRERES
jgi:hypothetical protein